MTFGVTYSDGRTVFGNCEGRDRATLDGYRGQREGVEDLFNTYPPFVPVPIMPFGVCW